MSVEDDIELKDLLVQTLTENGCLAKIKAQLRASVFLALEEDIELSSKKPFLNEKVKSCLESSEGQLMFCIVKEFLEYFNLQSTMAVFDVESYLGVSYQYIDRAKISEDLGFNVDGTVPLLQQVLQIAQRKPKVLEVNLNVSENFEVTNNNLSNSENSIKTDSNLNGELSDDSSSSSSNLKENGINNINEESLDNTSLNYENGNETNEDFNKTFITEPSIALKQFENTKNSTLDALTSFEEIPVNSSQHIMLPVNISDKIDEITTPVLKDLKISPERVKSPTKSDKFKSKNSLNSLSDLPPLNMNKNRSGAILPSLYSKEFMEKPNS
ncbi:hypothetical protein HHI36_019294 [Cryptolaemus montrouzieri]|uniref:FGFR1 oncogene partner (FOP) N-terminal dimerisation domain-containing protein n=1 Tax=Cryptolaemus montrouzieri TaxID=559131 RepID=A0ABD2P2L1_9CUCU